MSDTEATETAEAAEFQEPAPETRRAVELTIAQLRADPRTVDCVAALERVLPVLALQTGVDPHKFPVWDVFQAVTDAWETATTRAWHEANNADPFEAPE